VIISFDEAEHIIHFVEAGKIDLAARLAVSAGDAWDSGRQPPPPEDGLFFQTGCDRGQ